jgi:hypothetical protein
MSKHLKILGMWMPVLTRTSPVGTININCYPPWELNTVATKKYLYNY